MTTTVTAPLPDPRLTTLGVYTKTVLENPYIFHKPTPKQAKFLMCPHREALFGGAAGGGKSDALLMAALQYVSEPGYSALILRKSYKHLAQPGAIMDRMKQWQAVWTRELGLEATWNENDKTMTFPSGARILFGHIAYENEKYNYLGAEYSACLWDELTQFNANTYKYLFSRLRRLKGSTVPIRMRSASNPGGIGHEWVRQRFVATNGMYPDRIFIPSRLEDNPYLTYEEYVETLAELDPVTREQMLKGDWTARMAGGKFLREWFRMTAELPPGLILKWTPDGPIVINKPDGLQLVRYWDLAATEPRPGEDPDWTAGALVAEKEGQYWILDIRRIRKTPKGVEDLIRRTAERDGHHTAVYMEREPGASGKMVVDHYARSVLKGYAFWGNPVTRNKEVRANPVSSAAEAGNVFIFDDGFSGTWVEGFIDEAEAFPNVDHDDQVDVVSGAFEVLAHPDDEVYEDLVSVEEPW